MDGPRFDDLTRALGAAGSRRALLRAAAGAAAGVLGLRRTEATRAKACLALGHRCRPGDQCCSGECHGRRCRCRPDLQVCGSVCVDPCPAGLVLDGDCVCACPGATVPCEGECRGPGTFAENVEHCGACGNRCPAGPCQRPICVDGECGVEPNAALIGTSCDPGDSCVENPVCSANGVCAGSPMNCGNCRQCLGGQCFNRPNGIACLGGTFRCCDGHCIQACRVGLECCGGACHEPCPFGAVRGEDCACGCPPELPDLCNPGTLDAYCTDFATDETNCGGCGTTCNAFATCFAGACRCCQGGSISCGSFSTDAICCDYPLSAVQCCNAPCDHPQLDCVMFCLDCGLGLECDFNAACPLGYGVPFTSGAGGPFPNACAG